MLPTAYVLVYHRYLIYLQIQFLVFLDTAIQRITTVTTTITVVVTGACMCTAMPSVRHHMHWSGAAYVRLGVSLLLL